jgi:hypothetical protein
MGGMPVAGRQGPFIEFPVLFYAHKPMVWSCPYKTGHPSILANDLRYSLGDIIFNPLWG